MIQKITGIVIKGNQLGRTIGFPTANIEVTNQELKGGTYKINVIIDGTKYAGVGAFLEEKLLFESHIFNFNQNLYGKSIEIYILEKIRENKKFSSFDELKNQIFLDKKFALENIFNVLTFGTFDIFHKGHQHYLSQASFYGDKLITIVATDKNVEKIKGKLPINKEDFRKKEILDSHISDEVLIGNSSDPLSRLLIYKPRYICLGYDQKGFSDLLNDFIVKNNLKTQIIRISSLNPEIYKSSILKKQTN